MPTRTYRSASMKEVYTQSKKACITWSTKIKEKKLRFTTVL
jgi:hypothetical protein